MTGCAVESLEVLINKCVIKWLSFVILKCLTPSQKSLLRRVEKTQEKLVKLKNHLLFNETCIRNKLLPTYTNIYIYA